MHRSWSAGKLRKTETEGAREKNERKELMHNNLSVFLDNSTVTLV